MSLLRKSSVKKLLAIGALTLAFPAQAAVTIDYDPGISPLPAGTTVIQNFDSITPLTSIGTNANVYADSVDGVAAKPAFNSSGNFAAILAGGSYGITFGAPTSIFSFVIGSLDSFNQLTLSFNGGADLILNGSQIALGALATGNQELPSANGRVTYTVDGQRGLLTGATFQSIGQNSMEIDDLAVAAVPEPATWLMMIIGFAGIGFSMRRKSPAHRVQFA